MPEGIAAAKKAGFDPIKINAVSIRGITEHEVVPLARYARDNGLEMRFIVQRTSTVPLQRINKRWNCNQTTLKLI